MTEPLFQDDWLSIYQGDCREVLSHLPEQSVQCAITSPPYCGLRSYLDPNDPDKAKEIGLEGSPDAYAEAMVEVFRGVKRVLRDDGTVWLNIGDSYSSGSRTTQVAPTIRTKGHDDASGKQAYLQGFAVRPAPVPGLGGKQLLGIPWRVAFALQRDGWVLRADCIWSKPNPMPSSVTDRPTISHEYVFLLAKNERYFYDADAVREPHTDITLNRIKYGLNQNHPGDVGVGIPPVRTTTVEGDLEIGSAVVSKGEMGERFAHPLGRNRRSVWTIPTVPYPGAHYAVFPPSLVEPCIKASTPEKGVCAECGAPWVRIVERHDQGWDGSKYGERAVAATGGAITGGTTRSTLGSSNGKLVGIYETTGWRPSCSHDTIAVPAVVLDPFAGSGTVGQVAQSLSRRAVLIDLNADYLNQQLRRNAQVPLGL